MARIGDIVRLKWYEGANDMFNADAGMIAKIYAINDYDLFISPVSGHFNNRSNYWLIPKNIAKAYIEFYQQQVNLL